MCSARLAQDARAALSPPAGLQVDPQGLWVRVVAAGEHSSGGDVSVTIYTGTGRPHLFAAIVGRVKDAHGS